MKSYVFFCRRSPTVMIEHEKAENRRQPSFTGPDGNPHQVRRKAAGGRKPPNRLPNQAARKRNLRVHGTGRYGQPRRPRNGAERRERKRGGRHPPGKKAEAARPPRKKPQAGAKQKPNRSHKLPGARGDTKSAKGSFSEVMSCSRATVSGV